MPAGTPPEKVQAAVRNFAREEFALKHCYVMALHTDETPSACPPGSQGHKR